MKISVGLVFFALINIHGAITHALKGLFSLNKDRSSKSLAIAAINTSPSSIPYAGPENNTQRLFVIEGMKCARCAESVATVLRSLDPLAEVSLTPPLAKMSTSIDMKSIQTLLSSTGPYKIASSSYSSNILSSTSVAISSYAPLALILSGITLFTFFLEKRHIIFNIDRFLRYFMANYFLTFAAFKLMNLKAFALAYTNYDLIAEKLPKYAYIYPFLELSLGIWHYLNSYAKVLHVATFSLMSVSGLGVWRALRKGRKIQCACLGTFFKLPMTVISLLEDVLMAGMALVCLLRMK